MMINRNELEKLKVKELIAKYPFLEEFLKDHMIDLEKANELTLVEYLDSLEIEDIEEKAIDPTTTLESVVSFTNQMLELLGIEDTKKVEKVTLIGGHNKKGQSENIDRLDIYKGEIISIVGPTGSGKSRLLADIEWGAQGDTPTKRHILIDDSEIDFETRFSSSTKLVAQLSQNMNFVMDLTVFEFLELHAKSRMVQDEEATIQKIFEKANELAGEKFELNTAITSLSGGQSRALMIADTAILSKSPIVLIDEIENAGIDRKKALELLVGEEKIVLMATHDPILALMGDKRIVISNGGIDKVMEISSEEKKMLTKLEELDMLVAETRRKLRYGEKISV